MSTKQNTPKRLFDKTDWDSPENVENTPWLGKPLPGPNPLKMLGEIFGRSAEPLTSETLETVRKAGRK